MGIKPKRVNLAFQITSSTGQSENSLELELQGAPFAQRAQIQELGSAALRKGRKEIPNNGMSKHEVFYFTAGTEVNLTAQPTFTKMQSVQHLATVFPVKTVTGW